MLLNALQVCWLLAYAAAHPSPHGFLTEESVPAHAVCESYVGSASRFVAPANDNNTLSTKQARYNPPEVIARRFDHIDTNTAPPSWLTSTPHTSQAKLVLAPCEVPCCNFYSQSRGFRSSCQEEQSSGQRGPTSPFGVHEA